MLLDIRFGPTHPIGKRVLAAQPGRQFEHFLAQLRRVVALDLMTVIGIGFVAGYSVATNQQVFLDVAVVIALIGFLATVAFAYYLKRGV